MQNYNTVEEKAAEWNVSIRHVQYLCRNEKVKGAIKRAGVWFIPQDMQIPVKNTKSSGAKSFMYVGTKGKIFDSAIELFRTEGFSGVNFKDIAHSAGIRQSAIYSHFRSKQEILDAIYSFYCQYYTKERISLKDIEVLLQKESLMDIIGGIRYEFKDEYQQKMTDISQIILQRLGVDEHAREIAKSLIIEEGIKYTEAVFDIAVEGGRIAPFDTHIMAIFINIVRIFTLIYWIVEPLSDNRNKLLEDEQELYKHALNFLVDLKLQSAED